MRPVVFLGPSLPWSEAKALLNADYRQPIKRGDLPEVSPEVKLIGIIDGVFMGEAAVGHREIIDALRAGAIIFGGSSMGALRAYELKDYGMKGIGEVFRLFDEGVIEGDDEVALSFNPETLQAISEPLVNMRVNLNHAVEGGLISAEQRDSILSELKGVYFPRRTKQILSEIARKSIGPEDFSRLNVFFGNHYKDIKKEDAIEVLLHLKKAQQNLKKGGKSKRP